jgi:hypothetical protein
MAEESSPGKGPGLRNRWPEASVAACLIGIAGLVIVDSIRVGQGWADDGPEAGYFPFYIGVVLLAASLSVLMKTLWQWRHDTGYFADAGQITSVCAVLFPMIVFVAGIYVVGIYLASLLLIAYFMVRHGKYGAVATVLVSVGVPLTLYFIFERWFLVLLPKGLLYKLAGF